MFGRRKVRDLTPTEIQAMLQRGEVVLIDVREPAEFAAERIHGFPLSTFDPKALPDVGQVRGIVFQCGSGKRSATAVGRCQGAGLKLDAHMAGGIAAWRQAGLPTVRIDPATGTVADAR
jgi:rhodanese-related sulfurtransferase